MLKFDNKSSFEALLQNSPNYEIFSPHLRSETVAEELNPVKGRKHRRWSQFVNYKS